MSDPFHLRAPTPGEVGKLAELGRTTFVETFGDRYHPDDLRAFLDEQYREELIAAELADPDFRHRIIEHQGELIAIIKTGPLHLPVPDPPPGAMEIRQLYVRQNFLSRGLGKTLTAWALESFEASRIPKIYLSVFSENERAIRFYQNHGFKKCGEYQYPVGRHLDLEWIMSLKSQDLKQATSKRTSG